jgi:hypothetical protein
MAQYREIPNFDFASLYPTTMKVYDDEYFEKIKRVRLRKKKLERILKEIEDSI